MPYPFLNIDQIRHELRQMVQANKRDIIKKLEDAVSASRELAIKEDPKEGEAKWLALQAKMQVKMQDVDGLYDQLFAFIENAQFPKDTA